MKMRDCIAKTSDGKFVVIIEGTGDSLLQEDIDAGYVDYVNYEIYATLEQARENEDAWSLDGGMVYLTKLAQEQELEDILIEMESEVGKPLSFVENFVG